MHAQELHNAATTERQYGVEYVVSIDVTLANLLDRSSMLEPDLIDAEFEVNDKVLAAAFPEYESVGISAATEPIVSLASGNDILTISSAQAIVSNAPYRPSSPPAPFKVSLPRPVLKTSFPANPELKSSQRLSVWWLVERPMSCMMARSTLST